LEIQSAARLRLDSSAPGRDLILLAGSSLIGAGVLQLEGSCRLVVAGNLETTLQIVQLSSSQLIVSGTCTIRTSHSLTGTLDAQAVIVTSNATLSVSSATLTGPVTVRQGGLLRGNSGPIAFASNVLVQAGGHLDLEPGSPTVNLSGVLTNRGTMRWISANNVFNLQGSGRVENEGVWEVFPDPSCPTCGAESTVRVSVNVPMGGCDWTAAPRRATSCWQQAAV
jgi:hypothetical protein